MRTSAQQQRPYHGQETSRGAESRDVPESEVARLDMGANAIRARAPKVLAPAPEEDEREPSTAQFSTRPELDMLADEIAAHAIVAIERAVGARARLTGVVASQEEDDFEKAAGALVARLRPSQLQSMCETVERSLGEPASDRKARLGHLADVKLGLSSSIKTQLDAVPFGERLRQGRAIGGAAAARAAARASKRLIESARELTGNSPPGQPRRDLAIRREEEVAEAFGPRLVAVDPASLLVLMEHAHAPASAGPALNLAGTGPIETKYRQLGGASGPLGRKEGVEHFDEDHAGRVFRVQYYERGAIMYGPSPEAYAIWGPIFDKWQALGGVDLPHLGVPIMDQRRTPDGSGWYCHFFGNGSIYYSPAFGAREVHGAIRAKWASLGWELGPYGYPKSDELATREPPPYGPLGAYSQFDHGTIYWSARHGAHAIPDRIDQIYRAMHAEMGNLGYPVWTSNLDGLRPVNFEGGRITVIDGTPQLRPLFEGVATRLLTVKAVKTTKEVGADEMYLTRIDVDSLGRKAVHKLALGEFRNSWVAQPNAWGEFAIDLDDEPHGWPRTYVSAYFLSEKDGSQMDDFTLQLITAVENAVSQALDQAAAIAGAATFGAATVVIAVLGEILAPALGKVWDYLKGGFGDDVVFPPVIDKLQLQSCVHYPPPINTIDSWFLLHSKTFSTSAQDGRYELQIQWLVGPTDPA